MNKLALALPILLLACSDGELAGNNSGQATSTNSSISLASSVSSGINTPVTSLPEEIDKYSHELAKIQNDPNAGEGVYGLWRMGQAASKALTQTPTGGGVDILERLSESQYQEVITRMKGYFVNRQEVVFVEPDAEFFLALAKRTTDQASIDFFASYSKTRPKGSWAPVYVLRQTDYSGCYRFGSMSLLNTYTLWDTYRKKYPSRYTEEVNHLLRELEEDLGFGTCACGSTKSAIDEFESFTHAHPDTRLTARLRERINQYKLGKSDIREKCISG